MQCQTAIYNIMSPVLGVTPNCTAKRCHGRSASNGHAEWDGVTLCGVSSKSAPNLRISSSGCLQTQTTLEKISEQQL